MQSIVRYATASGLLHIKSKWVEVPYNTTCRVKCSETEWVYRIADRQNGNLLTDRVNYKTKHPLWLNKRGCSTVFILIDVSDYVTSTYTNQEFYKTNKIKYISEELVFICLGVRNEIKTPVDK